MNWTKFAKGLTGISRIECDIIPVNNEYGIKIATPAFAIALAGFRQSSPPKELEEIVRSFNVGAAKKAFERQRERQRPYDLSRTCLTYDPDDKTKALCIYEGTYNGNGMKKTFFIKKRYLDLIPGDITALCAGENIDDGILFISTQSYGYILPHRLNPAEREAICEAANLLKGVL